MEAQDGRSIWKTRLRRSPLTRWIPSVKSWLDSLLEMRKRRNLLSAMRTSGLRDLIETGTYRGDTAHFFAARGYTVLTVELEPGLAALARQRFKNFPQVTVLEGDSGDLMNNITKGLSRPALFYLDGHYSGGITARGNLETPILREIDAILNHAPVGSVVVIDDARCFGRSQGYPALRDVLTMIRGKGVKDALVSRDTIRFSVPHSAATGFP